MLHDTDDKLAGVSIKLKPAQTSITSKSNDTRKHAVDKKVNRIRDKEQNSSVHNISESIIDKEVYNGQSRKTKIQVG